MDHPYILVRGIHMTKYNGEGSVNRSRSRGASARGTSGLNSNGVDAYKQARKSTKGHYRVEFTKTYDRMTDKDIELREVYGKDLVAARVGVPGDMIKLQKRGSQGRQTLTSLDEVYYVKVGSDVYGKLSIRTQRLWKGSRLVFVFQTKRTALKPPQKAFSRSVNYKKKTKGHVSQAKRKSYNRRKNK